MENSGRQIVKIIREICEEHGIPLKSFSYDWIMQLEIKRKNIFIYGYQFQNNNAASQLICGDKSALSDVLIENGVNAVKHYFFMTPTNMNYVGVKGNWDKMTKLLHKYQEVVCKDNTGTGGNKVYKAMNQYELESAVSAIFKTSRALSICPFYEIEEEYRVILLNGVVELVYRKDIPFVVGDGVRGFADLCFNKYGIIDTNCDTDHNYVVPAGVKVKLNWKHNLDRGASAKIIQNEPIKTDLEKLALSAAKAADIAFASIDIIQVGEKLAVLEINSGVMMENFARASEENYKISKKIYAKALGLG